MSGTDQQGSLQARLTSAFRTELPIPAGTEGHLAAALVGTLERTGNFIRALLAYSMATAYRVDEQSAMHLAIALEYFHTASLLFDDLPSMDDATHRRGAKCIHHVYGEGPTTLAALGLINRAYALLWRATASSPRHDQARALTYVEKYLGLGGLLNGQSLDLHYSELSPSDRSPQKVAMGKTVALIRLSLVLPAIVGGANSRAIRLLDRLAIFWGLAYQALDDLKDVLHDSARAGKTTARDTALDRPNLALSFGPAAAMQRLEKLASLGERIVRRLQETEPRLVCLELHRQRLQLEVEGIAGELLGARR